MYGISESEYFVEDIFRNISFPVPNVTVAKVLIRKLFLKHINSAFETASMDYMTAYFCLLKKTGEKHTVTRGDKSCTFDCYDCACSELGINPLPKYPVLRGNRRTKRKK